MKISAVGWSGTGFVDYVVICKLYALLLVLTWIQCVNFDCIN